jgi:hypothetical protein
LRDKDAEDTLPSIEIEKVVLRPHLVVRQSTTR